MMMRTLLVTAVMVFLPSIVFAKFDLGGPCFEEGKPRPQAEPLNYDAEKAARAKMDWPRIIENDRWSVRNGCSVPYRWEVLFQDLVSAHRYSDAASVLDQLPEHKIVLPHAIIAKAGAEFLRSPEFAASASGKQFLVREKSDSEALELAKRKLASMSAQEKPPNPYKKTPACPFECCQFGKWTAVEPVQLLESPGSSRIVEEIPAKKTVEALTGEVLIDPTPYAIMETRGLFKRGDVIFFLDYLGEGSTNYWYAGRASVPENLESRLAYGTYEDCQSNGGDTCWLKRIHPEKAARSEWWVKIKSQTGKIGWVLVKGQFHGADACG
jgi:hypothetical protein